jgi:hypothetical protein
MTIAELLAERPELRATADILIKSGAHVDDVIRALSALPGERQAATIFTASQTASQIARPAAHMPALVSPVAAAASWDEIVATLNAELQRDHLVTVKRPAEARHRRAA